VVVLSEFLLLVLVCSVRLFVALSEGALLSVLTDSVLLPLLVVSLFSFTSDLLEDWAKVVDTSIKPAASVTIAFMVMSF
jgi:hypothetical protein